jgi:site-specific DNA recombinase
MEAPRLKALGIWIGVSTEDQARGESPEHHEKRTRFCAEAATGGIVPSLPLTD